MTTGIYKLFNTVTGDFYIGRATDVHSRLMVHFKHLHEGCKGKRFEPLVAAHGVGSFAYVLIEECSQDRLDEREWFWCHLLQPTLNDQIPSVERTKKLGRFAWTRQPDAIARHSELMKKNWREHGDEHRAWRKVLSGKVARHDR